MIITEIYGGLGNQLFQFAAGYSLAKKKNTSHKLDVQFFAKQNNRYFELSMFNINYSLAENSDLDKIKKRHWPQILQSIYYKYQRFLPYFKRNLYNEKSNRYDTHFFEAASNCILNGYWQDHRYFKEFDKEIKLQFRIKEESLSTSYFKLLEKVKSANSVSIHVRRGDYISIGVETPSMDYYFSAIQLLQDQFYDLTFFVFSDDIQWCKENFPLNEYNLTFVDPELGLSGPEEMQLMSNCKHNIIANSTFSWWSAFLNENPNKVVIYPRILMKMLNPDLIFEKWNII